MWPVVVLSSLPDTVETTFHIKPQTKVWRPQHVEILFSHHTRGGLLCSEGIVSSRSRTSGGESKQ